jgi:hypothetical protein
MPKAQAQTKKMVRVPTGTVKDTVTTRTDAGNVIATNAPNSAILTANADVKTTEGNLVAANTRLDDKYKQVKALELELATERGALLNLTVDWDSVYDVYVSTARLYCLTDQDAKSLGLPAAGLTTYQLAPPISVTATFDAKLGVLRIHVKRPAGLKAVRLEISPEPMTATSFKALDGEGATAKLSGYPPGIYWVRAAMIRSRQLSAYTTPVSVVVK